MITKHSITLLKLGNNMKTIGIVGYLNGSEIGVIDSDGKFNTSEKLDFNSRKFFDSKNDAESYIEKLNENETNMDDFKYQIDIYD